MSLPTDNLLSTILSPITPAPTPAPAPAAPAPALDNACDALRHALGLCARQQRAGVPREQITRWQAVLDHPGLAARFDDPRACAYAQLRIGNAPPRMAALDRWARRTQGRAATTPPPALTPN